MKIYITEKQKNVLKEGTMNLWHGTTKDFDNFDLSHAKEGMGHVAFGYGVYATNHEETAHFYAIRTQEDSQVVCSFGGHEAATNAEKIVESYLVDADGNVYNALRNLRELVSAVQSMIEDYGEDYLHDAQEAYQIVSDAINGKNGYLQCNKPHKIIYEVEVPEDNGSNYIEWLSITPTEIEKIADACGYEAGEPFQNFKEFYETLSDDLGSAKEASNMLKSLGYDGVKIPTRYGDGFEYTIFDPNDVKIINKKPLGENIDGQEHPEEMDEFSIGGEGDSSEYKHIQKPLTESITDVTYHFTTPSSLKNILNTDSLYLTMSTNGSDTYDRKKLFYLSTQRTKSCRMGYASNKLGYFDYKGKVSYRSLARITLNGYELKKHYKGRPLDYWRGSMGKQTDIGLNAPSLNGYVPTSDEDKLQVLKNQQKSSNFEFEDRIIADTPVIKDAHNYITRIDVLIGSDADENELLFAKHLMENNKASIPLYFYTNPITFDNQKGDINAQISSVEGDYVPSDERHFRHEKWCSVALISALMSLLFYDQVIAYKENEASDEIRQILGKFNLEEYHEDVMNKLSGLKGYERSIEGIKGVLAQDSPRKFNHEFQSENANNVMRLTQFVMQKFNAYNMGSMIYNFQHMNDKKDEVKTQPIVHCCWMNEELYDAESTSLWNFLNPNCFYSDMEKLINGWAEDENYNRLPQVYHNSKSDESFMKYIEHWMHNENFSLYEAMTNLNKLGLNKEQLMMIFSCVPRLVDIDKRLFKRFSNQFSYKSENSVKMKLFGSEDNYWNEIFDIQENKVMKKKVYIPENKLHLLKESYYELCDIGSVEPEWDFDEDDYAEYLEDEGLQDTEDVRMEYIKDYCTFELAYTDSETFHYMDCESMSYDEMEEKFGTRMANDMLNACINGESRTFEPLEYTDDDNVDTTDIKAIEADAIKKLRHGEYFSDARGFILHNGEMVYTDAEHNMITRVAGIQDKFQAIKMGMIRVLPNSIDIGALPTQEQNAVLGQVIRTYSDDVLYLDLFSEKGEHGCKYINPRYQRVISDIQKFYTEGIKPLGEGVRKNKNIINEYHHGINDCLMQDAETIVKFVSNGYYENQDRTIFDCCDLNLNNNMLDDCTVRVKDMNCCAYDYNNNVIYISENDLIDAINEEDYRKLTSAVYHELGHVYNYNQTLDNTDSYWCAREQMKSSFKEPWFLEMNDDEYKEIMHILYRFREPEMRARCFETAMWLKQYASEKPTLRNVYDNRCSDITLMQNFVNRLKVIAQNNDGTEENKDKNMMCSLSSSTWDKEHYPHCKDWGKICRNTIAFFEKKLEAFKVRINKIYCDYAQGYNVNESVITEGIQFEGSRFEVSEIRYNYCLYEWNDPQIAQPFFGYATGEVVVKNCGTTHNDYRRLYADEDLCIIGRIWAMEDGNMFAVYIPCGTFYQTYGEVDQATLVQLIKQAYDKTSLVGSHKYYVNAWNNNIIAPLHESKVNENMNYEVAPSQVDLSSFEVEKTLEPHLWHDMELDGRARLKLLDVADDFMEFLNLSWIKPKEIVLLGSSCNYNWSEFSDIDLHIILDYNEIGENPDIIKEYMDMKKNEWNNEHSNLTIYDLPIEIYVQNIDEEPDSEAIYSLTKNEWLSEPNPDSFENLTQVDSEKVKILASSILTAIDDIEEEFETAEDKHQIEELGKELDKISNMAKTLRQQSLEKDGEMGNGNIVYKVMRRFGYLDKLWDLQTKIYDKINSID